MIVHLSLGSNVGDRESNLKFALNGLKDLPETRVDKVSAAYATDPWGETSQPAFLNIAVEIWTAFAPPELLNACKAIEARLGPRSEDRWGPRFLDIDIVLWGDATLRSPELTLPHPEFRNRAFVLAPLSEIAPDARDPVTGRTVAELAAAPEAVGVVTRLHALDH